MSQDTLTNIHYNIEAMEERHVVSVSVISDKLTITYSNSTVLEYTWMGAGTYGTGILECTSPSGTKWSYSENGYSYTFSYSPSGGSIN